MNIVLICNEYPPAPHGGIGTFVEAFAHGLVGHGHTVSVVGLGPRASARDDGDVRVITIEERVGTRIAPILNRWRLRKAIAREVARIGAEIVETPEYAGPMPFRFRACAVVVRTHLSGTAFQRHAGQAMSRVYEWCERRTLALHRNWIYVSQEARRLTTETFGLEPQRSAIVHYPVSVDQMGGAPALPPLPARFVLFGGTISRRKGAVALAQAAKTFLKHHPGVDLVYAGGTLDGTDATIRRLLGDEFAQRVTFLGALPRAEFLECIRRCEVFAFPSTLETFGLVVAEAMLCRKPVVTSNISPFVEFVQQDQTGLLIDPSNATAIAEAVDRLLRDEALRAALGGAGQAFVRQTYSLEKAIEASLAFYRQVLGRQTT